jgi:hypothetical protein
LRRANLCWLGCRGKGRCRPDERAVCNLAKDPEAAIGFRPIQVIGSTSASVDGGAAEGRFGHETAEATLLDALRSGRMHHAWLITRPDGVRKLPVYSRNRRKQASDQNLCVRADATTRSVRACDYVGGWWHACWV